ncbi:glycosyltransferase family 4 protein [Rheinheimera baltica]|uniref:glycosyltransferase family 4 protein n=1 Tax=Rheinheimera baltica TaxID=67576 RepID=UPI00273D82E6|nr:glycosyltransferase family 4 protein [Rheinheimera baltica]MDP5149792.1 glycosyltransferase family 4 protein [Rheinheimera baltica]
MNKKHNIAMVGTLVNALLDFRADLIIDMVAKGHTVYAFACDFDTHSEQRVRSWGAIPVPYKISRSSLNPLSDLVVTYRLFRLFRQLKIDVSFCYFVKPVIYGNLAAVLAGVTQRAVKIEGLGWVFTDPPTGVTLKLKILRLIQLSLYRITLPLAHTVFLLNPDDRRDLVDKYGIKIKNLVQLDGIGVNLTHFSCCSYPQTLRFVFVGRLLKEKGIGYFLCAATALKQKYPDVEFIVLGAPDSAPGSISKEQLTSMVECGTLLYPGRVSNVADWLQNCSVFVLPSYYREGVPRSTMEAMAMGRPVITTNVAGCKETVIHGQNGFLVEPHDVESLISAMETFVLQPELVQRMGLKSRQLAQTRFDVIKVNQIILTALCLDKDT